MASDVKILFRQLVRLPALQTALFFNGFSKRLGSVFVLTPLAILH